MLDKDRAALALIQQHFAIEPGLVRIYRVFSNNEDDPMEPIKLVEINEATVATGTFEAYGFKPSRSIPFPTLIAEVTPHELENLQQQERWPAEWDLSTAREYLREAA